VEELIEALEQELKNHNIVSLAVMEKLEALKEFSNSYEAMVELISVILPLNYQMMFETEDGFIK
ncbi:uncharacterized protein METZ01_LOCUS291638, partial [marine metagenome]|tara:strand:- start:925 stop:1116 length:192 start_codon:yes stop_codon:yes gene_type:complete